MPEICFISKIEKILIAAVINVIIVIAIAGYFLYPPISNMNSEYATARIISEIEEYVVTHRKWPSSAKDINNVSKDKVYVNYSISLEEIVKDKKLLESAVHPESGKSLTYPHYTRDINRLFNTIEQVISKENKD